MKTRRLGYDGQGTVCGQKLVAAPNPLGANRRPEVLLEEFIPFEKELAVMVARGSGWPGGGLSHR
jgi:5-(carboxyamino)imidazole ribonucleotide synthase